MDVFTREKGWQPGAEEGEEDQMAMAVCSA